MVRWCHLYGKTFGRRKFISCWQINDRKLFRPSSVHKSTKRRESSSLCKSHFHYKRLADGFFNNVIASQTVSEPKRWNDSGKNMRFQLSGLMLIERARIKKFRKDFAKYAQQNIGINEILGDQQRNFFVSGNILIYFLKIYVSAIQGSVSLISIARNLWLCNWWQPSLNFNNDSINYILCDAILFWIKKRSCEVSEYKLSFWVIKIIVPCL